MALSSARVVKIRELVELGIIDSPIDGNHGEIHPKTSDFVASGIPFITAADLAERRVDLRNCHFIAPELAETLRKGFAIEGDVLLTHKATLGRTAIVPKLGVPYIVLTPQVTYYRVKDSSQLNSRFLRYYFDSPAFQATFESWAQKGATRAYLGITAQLDLPVLLPAIEVQRRIGEVLSSYDDLIENNRRRIALLEESVRLLYREWFVRFRFPGHDRVKSKNGVPEGWTKTRLHDAFEVTYGFPFRSTSFNEDGIGKPLARIRDVLAGVSNTYTDENADGEYMLCDGDFLIGMDGDFHMGLWTGGEAWLNQRVCRIRSRFEMPSIFVWAQLKDPIEKFNRDIAGTTVAHLGDKHLKTVEVLLPSQAVMQAITEAFRPLGDLYVKLRLSNRMFSEARDALLPRLMSGSISV